MIFDCEVKHRVPGCDVDLKTVSAECSSDRINTIFKVDALWFLIPHSDSLLDKDCAVRILIGLSKCSSVIWWTI
jgi:hypothetical protein